MSAFGAFAPFGLLAFGAEPTDAERMFASMQNSMREAFDVSEGTHVEASNYARAMAMASLRVTLRHGANQSNPRYAVEMLDDLGASYLDIPVPGESLDARRGRLSALEKVSRGSRIESLESAIRDLIGADNLLAVRVLTPSEAVASPNPDLVGAWNNPALPHRVWKLLSPVASSGSVTVSYVPVADSGDVQVGDRICVQPENWGLAEAVLVIAATSSTFTASFAKSHDVGAHAVTHAPMSSSTQRTVIVVTSSSVARDINRRRAVFDLVSKMVRGVTHVFVVEPSGPHQAGPFVIDQSFLGATPLGVVTF